METRRKIINAIKGFTGKDKIFVTGMSRCGKTEFAKAYSELNGVPYIDFDNTFNFDLGYTRDYVLSYLRSLPSKFIIDGVPFELNLSAEYIVQNDASLVCSVCTNPIVWINRMFFTRGITSFIKDTSNKLQSADTVQIFNHAILSAYYDFATFYYKTFNVYREHNIEYTIFGSFINQFLSESEMMHGIRWSKVVFGMDRQKTDGNFLSADKALDEYQS